MSSDKLGYLNDLSQVRPTPRMIQRVRSSFRKSKQRSNKAAKVAAEMLAMDLRDQRFIRSINGKMSSMQTYTTVVAIVSIFLGIITNELCVAGEYRLYQTVEQFVEAMQEKRCNHAGAVEGCKFIQTCLTVCLLSLIIIQFRLGVQFGKAKQGLIDRKHKGTQNEGSDFQFITLRMKIKLAAELCLCSIHTVPFVNFNIRVDMLGQRVYYRVDSLLCAIQLLRVYHVFRAMKLTVFYKYFNMEESFMLRDEQTLKMLQDSQTRFGILSFKVAISRHPFAMISTGAFFMICFVTYLFRIAEGPANQPHSAYIWDQLWFIFVTLTTTGYGDLSPVTHLGRFAAVCTMGVGPIIVAFMTASITRTLSLSTFESYMMYKMDSNHLRFKVLESAARILQFWWRAKKMMDPEVHPNRRPQSQRRRSISVQVHHEQKRIEIYRSFYLAIGNLKRFHEQHNDNVYHVAASLGPQLEPKMAPDGKAKKAINNFQLPPREQELKLASERSVQADIDIKRLLNLILQVKDGMENMQDEMQSLRERVDLLILNQQTADLGLLRESSSSRPSEGPSTLSSVADEEDKVIRTISRRYAKEYHDLKPNVSLPSRGKSSAGRHAEQEGSRSNLLLNRSNDVVLNRHQLRKRDWRAGSEPVEESWMKQREEDPRRGQGHLGEQRRARASSEPPSSDLVRWEKTFDSLNSKFVWTRSTRSYDT